MQILDFYYTFKVLSDWRCVFHSAANRLRCDYTGQFLVLNISVCICWSFPGEDHSFLLSKWIDQ